MGSGLGFPRKTDNRRAPGHEERGLPPTPQAAVPFHVREDRDQPRGFKGRSLKLHTAHVAIAGHN